MKNIAGIKGKDNRQDDFNVKIIEGKIVNSISL
jgi:hypothetical protein